ncbi:DUF885 domain-containing protein [Hyphococcus flavus]|uniref:DUF885 domain-containing protein n=1 Tax=Hyphococcus flavus TaxID=1866326 RepID=A0AAE9ZHI6_9PROT|nr:DUF885 domain-containing protein [Hyphococcus flavus]WDI30315.1 DUF885 domain-containing protein [Hyphococcus flavus]
MKKLYAALLCATALTACNQSADGGADSSAVQTTENLNAVTEATTDAVESETERLNAWFAARWEETLDFSPMLKTRLGMKEDNDKINDLSLEALDEQLQWQLQSVAEMQSSFDYDLLSPEAKMSYDIWVYNAQRAEAAAQFRDQQYIFTQMLGAHASIPNFLINFHTVDTVDDMHAYNARINGVARAVTQLLERAQANAEKGTRPPRFAYEGVIEQSSALITGAPFDDAENDAPLWADAKSEIDALLENGVIDEDTAEQLRNDARTALLESFGPAYEALVAWMSADMVNVSAEAAGVSSLNNGEAFYADRLAASTTTDMIPDEVHQYGLDEVARIHQEMEAIKDRVGFDGTLQEFFVFTRDDEQFYFPNTDEGREAYLQAAREHLAFIDERLPQYFGILPKADLVVRRVEAFREQDGGAQHYNSGTPDGSRPGTYYAHLSDMTAMPIPQLEVIAYHEGNPGHHMQISIAQELTGLPTFRTQNFVGAYSEGWALYSELLAKEMGAYEDDYSDFGRLTSEIWRAIRLVVDTGIHYKGWSEEQAVAYFMANSPAPEGQIRSEVKRYFVWPGQATSYKIGMRKIQDLRARAEAELGDQFDIRDFHDTVLGGGALPLAVLERRVDSWIETEKSS